MERVSLTDQVVAELREDILGGVLRPGTSLREVALSERFDVARSTIREAVKGLVAEGLLSHEHHRGVVVIEHTVADVEDLLGARMMIDEGILDGPDPPEAIIGLHAWPGDSGTLMYRSGGFMAAADNLQINVTGIQTHGSSPWLGVDPIYVAAQIATAIQGIPSRHLDITNSPAVITIGSIHGGVRGNIIPDRVEMLGTIRTFDVGIREELHAKLRSTVNAIAEANGASAEVILEGYAPVTGNHPELLRKMMPTLNWAAGDENVNESTLITGAEDFSFFQERMPGLFLMLGINDPSVSRSDRPSNHSPFFIAEDSALMTGVRTLVGFALELETLRVSCLGLSRFLYSSLCLSRWDFSGLNASQTHL